MASRKDLLKAHQFTSRRLLAAMVSRRPDSFEAPLKRITTAFLASVMVAVLFVGASAVIGLVTKRGGNTWRQDKTVVVDSNSGVSFAYLQDKLYPTLNITSALLATDGGPVKSVKASALRGVEQEAPIGIPQAPDQLPGPKAMISYPINVCSSAGLERGDRRTIVQLGRPVPQAPVRTAAVRDSSGREFLLTQGLAYEVPEVKSEDISQVLVELGFPQPMAVDDAWINAVPHGPPLRPLNIESAGEHSKQPLPAAELVGSLVHVEGGVDTYYVLLEDGLSRISPLESRVLSAATGEPSQKINSAEASGRLSSSQPQLGDPDLPTTLPVADPAVANQAEKSVCLAWRAADQPGEILIDLPTPAAPEASTGETADFVDMEALTGVLLSQDQQGTASPVSLITDGLRYPVADPQAQAALGYADTSATPVSSALLALVPVGLPAGQKLSIEAATLPA